METHNIVMSTEDTRAVVRKGASQGIQSEEDS